ncbi:ABC transporter permease [Desertibacillus haloalkaliphilus]|nr:ABC transporter permease [Desertibacillus haloalkaliphilus]
MREDVIGLWKQRVKDYWNEAIRYLRLIANSGFLFTIYILIILGSYYYSLFLDWLPDTFPTVLFFALVIGFLLTKSPVRTFVKQADIVFLLPLEAKLDRYFRASIVYTMVFQAFTLVLVMIVLSPMYFQRIAGERYSFLGILLILLAVKFWNITVSWEEQRLQSERSRAMHKWLRLAVNISFALLVFEQAPMIYLLVLAVVMLALTLVYYRHLKRMHSVKWEHLIEVEERMLMSFYRMANSFTDVPHLKAKVKQRAWLSAFTHLIPFRQQSTFQYLFFKSFIRSNDYLGIYVRLLFIAGLLIYLLPSGYMQLFIFALFLYMSGLQLSTLWNHYTTKLWIDLYPLPLEARKQSFSFVVFILLLCKSVILTLVALLTSGAITNLIMFIVVGVGFSYFYGYKLVHRRKKYA